MLGLVTLGAPPVNSARRVCGLSPHLTLAETGSNFQRFCFVELHPVEAFLI
jgi:hypothetical protein